jgi:hypothetical protein
MTQTAVVLGDVNEQKGKEHTPNMVLLGPSGASLRERWERVSSIRNACVGCGEKGKVSQRLVWRGTPHFGDAMRSTVTRPPNAPHLPR